MYFLGQQFVLPASIVECIPQKDLPVIFQERPVTGEQLPGSPMILEMLQYATDSDNMSIPKWSALRATSVVLEKQNPANIDSDEHNTQAGRQIWH